MFASTASEKSLQMEDVQQTTVADLVVQWPGAHHIFHRHGIDFCCGGNRSLEQAAVTAGIDLPALVEELNNTARSSDSEFVNWGEASILELVSFIVDHYHRPLKSTLPALITLSGKVLSAHGGHHGEMLEALHQILNDFVPDLHRHLLEEEEELFPRILTNSDMNLEPQVRGLITDHNEAGGVLDEIRRLTGEFSLPDDACPTFEMFWGELSRLDIELRQHIHLENNILFPKVLQ